jgi:RNA exonuclease 1
MITSIASVKKRPIPDSPSHPSVGSEKARTLRALEQKNASVTYTLTLKDVEALTMDEETMRLYGMPMAVPAMPGGERPSAYGEEKKCDRCGENALITHDEGLDACLFHWGRSIRVTTAGETGVHYNRRLIETYNCRRYKEDLWMLFCTLSILTRMSSWSSTLDSSEVFTGLTTHSMCS